MFKKRNREYLRDGRLADVLALIQILALHEKTRRINSRLENELRGKPNTADDWVTIGRQHREFFNVVTPKEEGKSPNVALIARDSQEWEPSAKGEDVKPVLPLETTIKLMDMATELHDRQHASSQAWRNWVLPMIVSGLALAGSIGSAYLTTFWKQTPATNINVYTTDVPAASRAQAAPQPAAPK
ncbi:hypothetical protein [Cupriavidus pauculus]|uniref:Transmembrane protein n=1 Tax=Cupriavidus pauculus TaxID=82633 RepID=A0A2N5C9K2_9BURK|nr:hypothetical protein [Cupriavidus pauculus]PLP98896.1 hypothetical protein CYJ10_19095 [Cupriavidus pauculus]